MPISTRVPLTRPLQRSHVALSLRSALACVEHELQQERTKLALLQTHLHIMRKGPTRLQPLRGGVVTMRWTRRETTGAIWTRCPSRAGSARETTRAI